MSDINTNWQQPAFNIVRCGHVELVVTDLARSRAFYVDTLGFVVTEESADVIYLRAYEERQHHSLKLRQGSKAMIGHIGYKVWSEAHLDVLAAHFVALGCQTQWVNGVEAGQGRALRVRDPLGFNTEFYYDMRNVEWMMQQFHRYRGPHILRIDHFNLHVPDVAAGYEYYRQLGFRCSEYAVADPPEVGLWAAWMYRKPGVHDVALTNGYGPRLHHVAFWLPESAAISRCCDILAAAGYKDSIERGPGRHGLSNAFFLYVRDPDGHRIEFYTNDYYTGDPDFEPVRWVLSDPKRATFWGSYAPRSWFEESSVVTDGENGTMPLTAPKFAPKPVAVN